MVCLLPDRRNAWSRDVGPAGSRLALKGGSDSSYGNGGTHRLSRACRGATLAALELGRAEHPMKFTLPPLPYPTSALEPVISREALELHHGKHHKAYVDKLNAALQKAAFETDDTIEQLLRRLDSLPASIREDVRNFGGGHANHSLMWETLAPGAGKPSARLQEYVDSQFGSLSALREQFSIEGEGLFGSGWVFLVWDGPGRRLAVLPLPNQDSPWSRGLTPLLPCDLWEHAHYLEYRNKRADWIRDWWYLINWSHVEQQLEKVRAPVVGRPASRPVGQN
jgi:Fe-Mn family superoxide dismutase